MSGGGGSAFQVSSFFRPPCRRVGGLLADAATPEWPGWTGSETRCRDSSAPFPSLGSSAPFAESHACLLTPLQALSTCPAACHCPQEAPKCAPGVGLVRDGCGCCKVCAKQLNEDCSKMQPCDHTKGLECNFGASSTALKGICRGKMLVVWPL